MVNNLTIWVHVIAKPITYIWTFRRKQLESVTRMLLTTFALRLI